LSSTFLHDSFVHLASSCYALGTIAPAVERALGPLTFLATYLLSGAAGSIATFGPRRTSGQGACPTR